MPLHWFAVRYHGIERERVLCWDVSADTPENAAKLVKDELVKEGRAGTILSVSDNGPEPT